MGAVLPHLTHRACAVAKRETRDQATGMMSNVLVSSAHAPQQSVFVHYLKDLGLWEAQFLQEEGDVREVHAEKRAASRADFHGFTH